MVFRKKKGREERGEEEKRKGRENREQREQREREGEDRSRGADSSLHSARHLDGYLDLHSEAPRR